MAKIGYPLFHMVGVCAISIFNKQEAALIFRNFKTLFHKAGDAWFPPDRHASSHSVGRKNAKPSPAFAKISSPLFALFNLLVILAAFSPAWADENTGLVLRMAFDKTNQDMIFDTSGKENHGTIRGSQWVPLKNGFALQFNGIDSCVLIQKSKSLVFDESAFSIETWIFPEDLSEPCNIIAKWGPKEYAIRMGGSYGYCVVMFLTSFDHYRYSTKGSIADGVWAHVVFVKKEDTLDCYINGKLSNGSKSGPSPKSIPDTNEPLRIGGTTGYGFFKGMIAAMNIYNRALSEEEIQANFKNISLEDLKPKPQ